MLSLTIVNLLLIVAAITIITGLVFDKKNKNLIFLSIAGGTIAVILGVLILTDPIQYVSGSTTEIIGDNITTTLQYNTVNNNSNTIMGWVTILAGLLIILVSTIKIYDRRFEEEKTYNW